MPAQPLHLLVWEQWLANSPTGPKWLQESTVLRQGSDPLEHMGAGGYMGVSQEIQCTLCWDVNPELQLHGTSTCMIIHTVSVAGQSEGRKQILLK